MLDENLPTFFLKVSGESAEPLTTVYLTQHGSEPEPAYTLRQPDPNLPGSKNCYALAIFDSYNPDVLFAEVLVRPGWTQPTLSPDEIRRNGGIPPPPQAILPVEFTIQLYNPDQQIIVKQRPGSWGASPHWGFEMPQRTFRQPSQSSLDRSQSDPAVAETTPKINFMWKRESKLSKVLICSLTGKSTNPDGTRKKNKEPDITVALFKSLREMTIYEPNMHRVEVEDAKGLEVVMLLGGAVIRDIYFKNIKEAFNITDIPRRDSVERNPIERKSGSSPRLPTICQGVVTPQPPPRNPTQQPHPRANDQDSSYPYVSAEDRQCQKVPRIETSNPRSQWEIDAETVRLNKQLEHEKRQRERTSQAQRRDRDRAEQAELKRVKKMVEAEEKIERSRQAEVAKETERLRRLYGSEEQRAGEQMRQHQLSPGRQPMPPSLFAPLNEHAIARPQSVPPPQQQQHSGGWPHYRSAQPQGQSGPYLQPPSAVGPASQSGFFGEGGLFTPGDGQNLSAKKKRSMWGLKSQSDDSRKKLLKKQSSMF
ncbi:MAG: hypothetical protein M1827_007159 [Pycnora praestabilis]|nr:MAG: hypothetical protein M1827_007159 [Pycnora praestabilis]